MTEKETQLAIAAQCEGMKYASVCSGVEAASLAWLPLGWKAAWFSEIEPFPCAVLKERFPGVPNLGDMTKIKVENLENGAQKFTSGDGTVVIVPGGVDLLVGGTPCQSFSVAGKREGLDGASGLARTFVELLGVMQPRWFVWENVPGCLSSRNKKTGIYDFNFLLAAFAEVGYSCGWKIYDAQYCRVDGYPRAIPQRRRRLFVIGHLGAEWKYPAEVLFEPSCLCRNTPPKRVKGKGFTCDVERSVGSASTLRMRAGCEGGGKGALVSNDLSLTLTAGSNDQTLFTADRCISLIPYGTRLGAHDNGIASTITRIDSKFSQCVCYENHARDSRLKDMGDCCQTLKAAAGTGCGNLPLIQETAVAIAENIIGRQVQNGGNGTGAQEELAYTQNASGVMGVAQGVDVYNHKETGSVAATLTANCGEPNTAGPKVMTAATVRRLLPIECERLMGFPDNWTRIPWKGKPEEDCPDSPRYKACGNSMCVNVMRWLGLRIELVERRTQK